MKCTRGKGAGPDRAIAVRKKADQATPVVTTGSPSTASIRLWYRSATVLPDQFARPIEGTTRFGSIKKPGNVRPTHAVLVSVVRVATTMPRRPMATAHSRTLVGARG